MKLTEMRELLDARDIQLTKSLGQNFLHDQNQLRRIVGAGELAKNDRVLEIGPGLGPLTELLVAESGHVLAIEKDGRLVTVLRERFAGMGHFELMHADALDVVRDKARDWSEWKLIANLPYSVASPILVELAQNPRRPERLVATLQLEVAHRLMARADSDHYGLLTLLVQLRYKPRDLYRIPRGCFFPEPDVDSGCIVLLRRSTPLLDDALHPQFDRIVKGAFSQRRKKMVKLLKVHWPEDVLVKGIADLGLPADVRGEKLTLEQFVALTKSLCAK